MIKELLYEGAENARSAKELATVLNMTIRDVTKIIENERRGGAPICGTHNRKAPGYFLAPDRKTLYAYCDSLQNFEKEIDATRKGLLKGAGSLPPSRKSTAYF